MSYIVMPEPFDSVVNTHSLNQWFSLGQCLPPRGHLALSGDIWGFPGGASGKEPACQCGRHKRCQFDSWVGKIPWRRAQQSTPVFLPGESHGPWNLAVDIFMAKVWGRHLVGRGQEFTEHPTTHGMATHNKELSSPDVNSPEVEKNCPQLALNKPLEVRSMSCLMLCLRVYLSTSWLAGRRYSSTQGGLKRKSQSQPRNTQLSQGRDHVHTGFPPH